jgi:L-aspartate oxidase
LASNSLLEGLVFGARAAHNMAREIAPPKYSEARPSKTERPFQPDVNEEALRVEIQQLMDSNVGIVRDAKRLSLAIARLTEILTELPPPTNRRLSETRNIAESGLAIACSAQARLESRGGHYRSDFPKRDDAAFLKHSILTRGSISFE